MTTPKDIRVSFDTSLLQGDFLFDSDLQDLESESGIESAVIVSLFTDRRAEDDDILPDPQSTDRRGWWGDLTADITGDQIGSRLWLLSREKTLESVLIRAKEYAEESLQWMLDDNIVEKIEVETQRQGIPGNDVLALGIKIYTFSGSIYTVSIPDVISALITQSVLFGGEAVLFGGEEVVW